MGRILSVGIILWGGGHTVETSLYEPLKKTVLLLIVDDDPEQLDLYAEVISGHPIYEVKKASTARRAEETLRSGTPPHVCILDMGIDDINNDEFFLLKKYSQRFPIIILSGSMDIERAFTATNYGAAGMVAKPPAFGSSEIWMLLSDVFLDRSLLPATSDITNPVFIQCCRILKEELPDNVSDWARKTGITSTYLRKIWSECYSFSPKHVLFLYKLYKDAFTFYNELDRAEINETQPCCRQPDLNEYRQRISYYLLNKTIFKDIRDKRMQCGGISTTTT